LDSGIPRQTSALHRERQRLAYETAMLIRPMGGIRQLVRKGGGG
jgi:hypothetical protein